MGIAFLNVVMIAKFLRLAVVVVAVYLVAASISIASPSLEAQAHHRLVKHRSSRTRKLAKAGGWAGGN